MTDIVEGCVKEKGLVLFRYVKPSHIENGGASDAAFQLRDGEPPEKYLSLFHSNKNSVNDRILDIVDCMKKRKFTPKRTGGMAYFDTALATKEINVVRKIVSFREEGYPHYGMTFISDDEQDQFEARTYLSFSADFRTLSSLI